MPLFSIYSKERRHYVGDFEFPSYIEARNYVEIALPSTYTYGHDALKDDRLLTTLVEENNNPSLEILRDNRGVVTAYVHRGVLFHYGALSMVEKRKIEISGYTVITLSRSLFLSTLNTLARG